MRARKLIESIVNVHIYGGQPVVHAGNPSQPQTTPVALSPDEPADASDGSDDSEAIEAVKKTVGTKAYSFKVKRNSDGQIGEIIATKI